MSSILRALKKLDEDAMSGEGQTDEQKIKMRQMVHRRTRAPRAINRFLFILLSILLVGTAALIMVNSNRESSITKKQEAPPQKSPVTQLPEQSSPLKKEIKKEPVKESKPPTVKDEQQKSSTKPAVSKKEPPSQPAKVEEPTRSSVGKVIIPKTNQRKEVIKENKQSEFVLNGVLWSDKPVRRVALINDRYLKEGDEINGVLVVKIEKKAVTLQSGEEKWIIRVKK